MKSLTFKDVPYGWAICFQEDCPLCQKCLRYAAAQLLPESVKHHEVVLPTARKEGDCSLFAEKDPVCVAYGMKHLLDGLEPWVATPMRHELAGIFGSRSHFYRYRDGDYPISPEQQERVAKLFKKYDVKRLPRFDKTFTTYYFPT